MSEREATGDFEYLFDDTPDESAFDALPEPQFDDQAWDDIERAPDTDLHFDAFDSNTWYFEPAPPPWYRTKPTLAVFAAVTIAAVALVVSGVLLVFRAPGTAAVDEATSVTQTAATTAPSRTASPTSAAPPPPAPPPTETSAAPAAPAPTQNDRSRSPSTRTTKDPEIGVTRTPATRSPISVAPQRPGSRER